MSRFWGVTFYEYRMGIRRWGMWIAFVAAGGLQLSSWYGVVQQDPGRSSLQWAGALALICNMLMPVVGGIVMADRMARDKQLGTREVLWATPLPRLTYVLGKYAGALLAVLTPVFLLIMAGAALFVAQGLPLSFLGQAALAFLGINAPAYVFVGAFALALPEVLPVRVFQVLYTGYWFWGNFLTPTVLPTLNGTLLTPKGDFVAGALFHVNAFMYVEPYTLLSAVASLLVLTGCAAAALFAAERYLTWQARRA